MPHAYAADAAYSTPMPPMPPMPANAVHDLPLLSKLNLRTCTRPRSRTRTPLIISNNDYPLPATA